MTKNGSLNHIYRSVWNQALGAMVAVAETTCGRGKTAGSPAGAPVEAPQGLHEISRLATLALGIALGWGAGVPQALANPTGASVVAGQAALNTTGNKLLVTTQNALGTNHSVINWQSFSIGKGESTYFLQPTTNSTSINRVVTNTPSQLFGTLGSNGNLVLVNQAGITVGAGAVVDTAGFAASALQMTEADALAGRLRFGDASTAGGAVSVLGNVIARSGDVVLLGNNVSTGVDALVQAPNGAISLVAGHAISISARGLEGINFELQAPADTAVNLGTLKGDAVGIFAGTLKHSGLIQASTAAMEGGKVVLKAKGDAFVEGAGKVVATGSKGGSVDVLGNRVAVTDQAAIDASGTYAGGTVRIGGDYQGKNADIQNAQITYFGPQASIKADATDQGDGGRVILWADDTTRAYGGISAKGRAMWGDGGFVETSGKQLLEVTTPPDAGATHGKAGTWLLDPHNVTIQASTGNLDTPPFSPTVDTSTIFNTVINTALTAGTTVVIDTGSTGVQAGNITVDAPISKSGATGATLTLNAANNININASITATTSALNLELNANQASSGGTTSLGNSVTVNLNGGTLSSTGGNVQVTSGNSVTLSNIGGGSGAITNGGTLTLNGATLGTSLANSGTVTVTGTTASAINGGLTNSSGATLNVAAADQSPAILPTVARWSSPTFTTLTNSPPG